MAFFHATEERCRLLQTGRDELQSSCRFTVIEITYTVFGDGPTSQCSLPTRLLQCSINVSHLITIQHRPLPTQLQPCPTRPILAGPTDPQSPQQPGHLNPNPGFASQGNHKTTLLQ
jgi:hypothetical protein